MFIYINKFYSFKYIRKTFNPPLYYIFFPMKYDALFSDERFNFCLLDCTRFD